MEDTTTNRLLERGVRALEALVALLSGQTQPSGGGFRAYYTDVEKDDSWVGFVNDEKTALEEAEEEAKRVRGGPPGVIEWVEVENGD